MTPDCSVTFKADGWETLPGSSHLLTVAYLVLQDDVVWLSRDGPVQSQAALCGLALLNTRHQRWHCADGTSVLKHRSIFRALTRSYPFLSTPYRHVWW